MWSQSHFDTSTDDVTHKTPGKKWNSGKGEFANLNSVNVCRICGVVWEYVEDEQSISFLIDCAGKSCRCMSSWMQLVCPHLLVFDDYCFIRFGNWCFIFLKIGDERFFWMFFFLYTFNSFLLPYNMLITSVFFFFDWFQGPALVILESCMLYLFSPFSVVACSKLLPSLKSIIASCLLANNVAF